MRRTQMIKLLGLSLLAAVGVMAMSASAAQAEPVLLRNGVPVDLLALQGAGALGQLLTEFGLTVHCEGSTLTAHLANLLPTVETSAHLLYEGCTVVGNSFCHIGSSPGAEDGHILVTGSGVIAGHEGETYYGLVESEAFTTVHFDGTFCTLPQSEVVAGSLRVSLLEAEQEAVQHVAHLDEKELFFGEAAAAIDGGATSLEEVEGAKWSMHL